MEYYDHFSYKIKCYGRSFKERRSIKMNRVLYFFPHNLMDNDMGCIRRAWMLLNYFKERNFQVDLAYSDDFWEGPSTEEELNELKKKAGVKNIFKLNKKPDKTAVFNYLKYKLLTTFAKKNKKSFPDLVTPYNRSLFNKLLMVNNYDYIIISYAYWANFIRHKKIMGRPRLLIDTHDFLTSQEQNKPELDLGVTFGDEVERLRLFDEVWAVSAEEQYVFGQFCKNRVRLIPIAFKDNYQYERQNVQYDLIYVASDNEHNIRSAKWFFNLVFPLIKDKVNICVIGKITGYIPDYPNLTKVPYAENLNNYYTQSRLAICPMLSGTGVKVKVLEALSYGIPVIASPRGVDGLVNKTDNGCLIADTSKSFATCIEQLIDDSGKYACLRKQAMAFFENHYSEQKFYDVMDDVFNIKIPSH